LTARQLLTILGEMAHWRVVLAAILSCSLPQTSLSRASSSPIGAIVYADHVHLDAGNASAGTTIFLGDKLRTEPGGSLQIRAGAASLLLSGSSSATLTQDDRPAAILTTGSAIFSTANSKAFALHVATAIIRPSTDLPTIGQVMVLNPKEFLVKSVRASLRIAVEDDVREIPEGAAYRIILDPTAAEPEPQGPRGAGAKGYKFPGKNKFIWTATSFAVVATVWAVHEALESPTVPNSIPRLSLLTRKMRMPVSCK
jgi:hypothetical protein